MKLQLCIILFSGIVLAVFGNSAKLPAQESFPVIPHVEQAPVIDGVLDEPVWSQALTVQLHYADADKLGEPDNPTTAYALTAQENGEEYIYFAFKCVENHPDGPFIANPNHRAGKYNPLEVSDFVRVRLSFGRYGKFAYYLFDSNVTNGDYCTIGSYYGGYNPGDLYFHGPVSVVGIAREWPIVSYKAQSKIFKEDRYWSSEIKVALRELLLYPGDGIPKYMELELFRTRTGDDVSRLRMAKNTTDNSDPDALILFNLSPDFWDHYYDYVYSWTRMPNPSRFNARFYHPEENYVYNCWIDVSNPLWFQLVKLESGTLENKLVSREDTLSSSFFSTGWDNYGYTQEERNRLRIECWDDTRPSRPVWKGDTPLIKTTPLEYSEAGFTQLPQGTTTDEGAVITFSVKENIDVALAIIDSQGKIIRHLAAGVLGMNPPAPLQANTLSQRILWDWKDDDGKVVPVDNYQVKVYLGITPKYALVFPKEPDVPEYTRIQYSSTSMGIEQADISKVFNLGTSEPGVDYTHRDHIGISSDTIYADPKTEEVYIGGYFIYDGITGQWKRNAKLSKKLPGGFNPELIVGPDDKWWLGAWCSLQKFDKNGNPVNWDLLESNMIPYINRGHCNPNRGHCFGGPDNDCYVVHHYVPHGNTAGVISRIGVDGRMKQWGVVEIPTETQCVKVDRQGYIYTSCVLLPKGPILIPPDFAPVITEEMNNYFKIFYGSVVKFSPQGGKIIIGDGNYLYWSSGGVYTKSILLGAEWVHPWMSPVVTRTRCACESSRFELDPFERLWIPDAVRSRIEITDKNANTIKIFGDYGLLEDSNGEDIRFGFPMAVSVTDTGCYVGDFFYRQGVKLDLTYKQEAGADIAYIKNFTIITASSLPQITQGQDTAISLETINGGSVGLHWQVIDGALPSGMSINFDSGLISGTPTQAGCYTFTLKVMDEALQESTKTFTLMVSLPPVLNLATSSLYNAIISKEYKFQLSADGGIVPYKWLLKSGSLPNGLSFNPETGYIYGTPKNIETCTFEIELSDSNVPVAGTVSKVYSLTVKQGGGGDYIAPAAITDLKVTQNGSTMVKFSWTSTGNDEMQGYSSAYIFRYSTTALSDVSSPSEKDNWWSSAIDATGLPKPKISGSLEEFTVFHLIPNTTYYFAIKAIDGENNISKISNICTITTMLIPEEYVAKICVDCSGKTGPCYTSLKDWQDDFGGIDYGDNAKGDLVAVNRIAVAECYNDWPDGMEADLELKGWNTDADHYIKIYAPVGQRHNSVDYNSGFWIKETHGWATGISIGAPYTMIESIGFFIKQQGSSGITVANKMNDVNIDSCIFKNNNRTYKSIGIVTGGFADNYVISNCVLQGLDTGIQVSSYSANGKILNSMAVSCNTGFFQGTTGGLKATISNSIAYKNLVSNWSGVENWQIDSTNNASNDTVDELIPGVNPVIGISDVDFSDYAKNNFHLSQDSKLRGKGVNLSEIFTKDIDGETRPAVGAWDIGVDEIPKSGILEDLNGDDKVDIADLQLCVNIVLGIEKNPDIVNRADVDGNGEITVTDVQILVNKILVG